MKEIKFVKDLVVSARNALNYVPEAKYPCISIDKRECEKYNMDIVSEELKKLGFTIVDIKDAPTPYSNEYLSAWFIYQEKELYNDKRKTRLASTKRDLTRKHKN